MAECPNCGSEGVAGEECPNCGAEIIVKEMEDEKESGGEVFSYVDISTRPFKDPDFLKKCIIGGLVSWIPIVGAIVNLGYNVEYIRGIISRDSYQNLPEWSNWEQYLKNGVMLFLASMIYGIVLLACFAIAMIPFWGSIISAVHNAEGGEGMVAIMRLILSLAVPLTIYLLVVSIFVVVFPLLQVLYAKSLKFSDAFNFSEMMKLIKADTKLFIGVLIAVSVIWLIMVVALNIVGIFGIIPILGAIVVFVASTVLNFMYSLVISSLYAEFYYKTAPKAGL